MVRSAMAPANGRHHQKETTLANKQPKPTVVTADTPPEELPPELRGTIFDPTHVERGAHLHDAGDTSLEGQMSRIKSGGTKDMANTKTKAPAKGAAKTNGKAPAAKGANKVSAKPAQPFDRVAASSAWAKESPCEAATGPKRDPRPCKGVGVVERETVGGKKIKVCAAHVLATEVATVAERKQAIADKEAAKAAKATPAPKAAAKGNGKAAAAKQPTKATPAPKPTKAKAGAKG